MPRQDRYDFVFSLLAEAAAKGAKCPSRLEIRQKLVRRRLIEVRGGTLQRNGYVSKITTNLAAREGRIKIHLYGKYWRVVEIMTGEHAGKRTALPPWGGQPTRSIP